MKNLLFCIFCICIIINACTSKKKLTYLQKSAKDTAVIQISEHKYKLKKGDNLSVEIKGLDPTSIALFNMKLTASDPFNPASVYLSSFTINNAGKITLPVIGNIKIDGITIDSATTIIQDSISKYFNQAFVYAKLTNFEISVLGEVNRPGSYTFYDNEITLLRALSTAGDLTSLGSRKHITIIRKNDKQMVIGDINLNNANFMKSPYFYLNSGDVIYVKPISLKAIEMNLAPWRTIFLAVSGLALALKLFGVY